MLETVHMLEKREFLLVYTCGRPQSQRKYPLPKAIHNFLQSCPKFYDLVPPPCGRHK